MTRRQPTRITDPAVMRAMAHPARLALLEHLSENRDGATATDCAAVVGLSPSATSYHLRALAKVGVIEEAPGRGDGRERVWQAVHASLEIGNDPQAGPAEAAAEAALVETVLARHDDKVRRYLSTVSTESREWYEATMVSERSLMLTARELRRLLAQLDEIVQPYLRRTRQRPPRTARPVSFQVRAVPTDQPATGGEP